MRRLITIGGLLISFMAPNVCLGDNDWCDLTRKSKKDARLINLVNKQRVVWVSACVERIKRNNMRGEWKCFAWGGGAGEPDCIDYISDESLATKRMVELCYASDLQEQENWNMEYTIDGTQNILRKLSRKGQPI